MNKQKIFNDFLTQSVKNNFSYTFLDLLMTIPIVLIQEKSTKSKNCLIISGINGEELSGPLSILKIIQTLKFKNTNLFFLPIINPTGFFYSTNENYWSQNIEYCFDIKSLTDENKTSEGKILLSYLKDILNYSKDCCIILQESPNSTTFSYNNEVFFSVIMQEIKQLTPDLIYNYTQFEQKTISHWLNQENVKNIIEIKISKNTTLEDCIEQNINIISTIVKGLD